ncbi:DUF721 domain-containing protein [Wielerella bovis]|uniref:DUF721 domain-containing protein n=1 Tax=Wielerella bovis TaxID=2917790 RepID=UPI00201905AF|nr:DUF721 domain-containing protein [Wielerella bovis]ULJ65055.1 DUF721 domain-containing protein [Wielerella bovis]
MQLEKIAEYDGQLKNLIACARYWQKLDSAVKQLIPHNLHPHFQVVCIENNDLVLHVSAPMAATRLKMLLPALLPRLQAIDTSIQAIRIKVRPKNQESKRTKNFHISQQALDYFEQTAKQLAHHPQLADAMQKLVEHNR